MTNCLLTTGSYRLRLTPILLEKDLLSHLSFLFFHLELLWNTMADIQIDFSDQQKLNFALEKMKVKWKKINITSNHRGWQGITQHKLNVTVLPKTMACRRKCQGENPRDFYIWHKPAGSTFNTTRKKVERVVSNLRKVKLWFIKENWMSVSEMTNVKGEKWLRCISNADVAVDWQ